jgi:hypothetical protein
MPTELLTDGIWRRITALAKRKPGAVAVAYCGTDARKLLPLKPGSLLVVNASEHAVRFGMTNPSELLWFFNRDVQIHSVENLHAKVFVFGDTAIVGSTNISQNSANHLQEAAVLVKTRSAVANCRRFVKDQTGEPLSLAHIKRLAKIYRPPNIPGHARPEMNQGKQKQSQKRNPEHPPLWLVWIDPDGWDAQDHRQASSGRLQARKRLRRNVEELDEFCSVERWRPQPISEGDLVIQVTFERGRTYLNQAAHVTHIKSYKKGPKRRPAEIVFLGIPRKQRRIERGHALAKLGRRHGKVIRDLDDAILVQERDTARAILKLWQAKVSGR